LISFLVYIFTFQGLVILNNSNESYVENNKSIHLIRGVKALKNCECALNESCFEQHGWAKINKLLYLLYKHQTIKVLIWTNSR
jgi:hypothetical protein